MNKNKGDLETSRSPLWGNICNLFQKYFKFIAIILILVLIVGTGILTMKVTALQKQNHVHISEKSDLIQDNQELIHSNQQLTQDNQDLKKETKVLQDNVIRLESEVQTGNEALVEYEEKLEDYETKKVSKPVYSTSWGSMKSYMSYKAITNTRSKQYQLQKQAVTDPTTGIRTINGDYCVAIGSGWGCAVGDRILVTLQGGKTFNALVADAKADAHTNSDNKTTTHDNSVIEFVVDIQSLPKKVRTSGNVGTLDQFSGGVVSITKR
jgi:vacuolar-type H+-ATPase subunit I/STV1